MSESNYWLLTCVQVSLEAGKVIWYSHLLKNFPQFVVIYTVKGFSVVSEVGVGVGVLRHYLAFSMIQTDVSKFISGSSAFSKSSLYIWRRQWHPTPVLCLENPMDGGAW